MAILFLVTKKNVRGKQVLLQISIACSEITNNIIQESGENAVKCNDKSSTQQRLFTDASYLLRHSLGTERIMAINQTALLLGVRIYSLELEGLQLRISNTDLVEHQRCGQQVIQVENRLSLRFQVKVGSREEIMTSDSRPSESKSKDRSIELTTFAARLFII